MRPPLPAVPVASTFRPDSSTVRHAPITSKFSTAKPSGSIVEWQLLQDGFLRCSASRSRIDAGRAPGLSLRLVSTPGGGGGTGRPKMLFSSHLPRSTGDVRSGYEVVASSAP